MHAGFPLPDLGWEPTRPFWDGAARHALALPRCASCGRLVWYPRSACPYCGGRHLTWTDLSGRGTLFSWVVVTHPFLPAFRETVPYVSALVAVDEDPMARVVTRIVDGDPAALQFDQAVDVVFRDLTFPGVDGVVTAPMFRPAG